MSGTDSYISFHRMLLPGNAYSVWYDLTPTPIARGEVIVRHPDRTARPW